MMNFKGWRKRVSRSGFELVPVTNRVGARNNHSIIMKAPWMRWMMMKVL
jgi:hypothetical protein